MSDQNPEKSRKATFNLESQQIKQEKYTPQLRVDRQVNPFLQPTPPTPAAGSASEYEEKIYNNKGSPVFDRSFTGSFNQTEPGMFRPKAEGAKGAVETSWPKARGAKGDLTSQNPPHWPKAGADTDNIGHASRSKTANTHGKLTQPLFDDEDSERATNIRDTPSDTSISDGYIREPKSDVHALQERIQQLEQLVYHHQMAPTTRRAIQHGIATPQTAKHAPFTFTPAGEEAAGFHDRMHMHEGNKQPTVAPTFPTYNDGNVVTHTIHETGREHSNPLQHGQTDTNDEFSNLVPFLSQAWNSTRSEAAHRPHGMAPMKVPAQLLDMHPADPLLKRVETLGSWFRATAHYARSTYRTRGHDLWRTIERYAQRYYDSYLRGGDSHRDTLSFHQVPTPHDLSNQDREFLAALRGLLLEQMPAIVSNMSRDYDNSGLTEFQELCALTVTTRKVFDVQSARDVKQLETYAENPTSTNAVALREWWSNIEHIAQMSGVNWRHVALGLTELVDKKLCCPANPLISGSAQFNLRKSLSDLNMTCFDQDRETILSAYTRILRAMTESNLHSPTPDSYDTRKRWMPPSRAVNPDHVNDWRDAASPPYGGKPGPNTNPKGKTGKGKGGNGGKGDKSGKGGQKGKFNNPHPHGQWWQHSPDPPEGANSSGKGKRWGAQVANVDADQPSEDNSGNGLAPA